jgi:hypothetical protein
MKHLRSFFHLPGSDQRLLITSAALLATIRLGLWLIPFQLLRRMLGKFNRTTRTATAADDVVLSKIVWAVSVLGSRLPGSCLTQALATQLLLGRWGRPTTLRIGVALDEEGAFMAHAWLENDGKIIIGGAQSRSRFSLLPPLKEEVR